MTTTKPSRRAARLAAVALPAASLLVAAPALADTPTAWEKPEPMSALTALLIFVGGPLAIITVISLLTLGPSLARGDRSRRGVASWTEPAWFGSEVSRSQQAQAELAAADRPHGAGVAQVEGRTENRADDDTERAVEHQTGGASARW